MRSFISLGCVVVAVAGAVAVAHGQSAPSAAAREALAQARQAHNAGRLPEAIEGYTRAYELSGDTDLLFQLGEVNRKLGQGVAALRFYRTYLAREPQGKHREAAERAATNLESKLPTPAPAAASAPALVPAPVAATPPPPAPSRTPPAPVTPLAPAAPAVAPTPAGAPATADPPVAAAPTPAAPAVDLRADITSAPTAAKDPPLPGGLAWAGVGATLALGAGAVITGLQASHRYDELRASCGRTPEGCTPSDVNQVKSRALVANVLWAATGVTALATGIIVVVNAREVGFAGAWSF